MTIEVRLAPEVKDDLMRIISHLEKFKIERIDQRITEIIQAFEVLKFNPHIGRPTRAGVSNGNRELVIGRNSKGYVALYRYLEELNEVWILSIRHQKEAGYS
jgi:toxin ParE1/3/4